MKWSFVRIFYILYIIEKCIFIGKTFFYIPQRFFLPRPFLYKMRILLLQIQSFEIEFPADFLCIISLYIPRLRHLSPSFLTTLRNGTYSKLGIITNSYEDVTSLKKLVTQERSILQPPRPPRSSTLIAFPFLSISLFLVHLDWLLLRCSPSYGIWKLYTIYIMLVTVRGVLVLLGNAKLILQPLIYARRSFKKSISP